MLKKDGLGNLRLLLLFKTSRSLEAFRSRLEAAQDSDEILPPLVATTAMANTLSAVFNLILSNMIVFLEEASKEILGIVRILILHCTSEL